MNTSIFVSLVRKSFGFLVSDYDFFVVQEDEFHVRFESNEVFLTVRYDAKRSYEVDVELGQLNVLFNGQERPFNLGEVLRTEGIVEGYDHQVFQSQDSEALERYISRLAELVSLNARDYLLNNKFSFERVSDRREAECTQYELQTRLDRTRRKVQVAWQNKDYSKVVALYKPIEDMLSEAEKKRLNFAIKHAQ